MTAPATTAGTRRATTASPVGDRGLRSRAAMRGQSTAASLPRAHGLDAQRSSHLPGLTPLERQGSRAHCSDSTRSARGQSRVPGRRGRTVPWYWSRSNERVDRYPGSSENATALGRRGALETDRSGMNLRPHGLGNQVAPPATAAALVVLVASAVPSPVPARRLEDERLLRSGAVPAAAAEQEDAPPPVDRYHRLTVPGARLTRFPRGRASLVQR